MILGALLLAMADIVGCCLITSNELPDGLVGAPLVTLLLRPRSARGHRNR